MTTQSDKLADDPIVEALLEIRFDADEIPEVVVGRLSELPLWRAGNRARLPAADIPAPVRGGMPEIRHEPVIEVTGADGITRVRIGDHALSAHFTGRYMGWGALSPILQKLVWQFFSALPKVSVTRIGLRYINLLTGQRHQVRSHTDLDFRIEVGKLRLAEPVSLAFRIQGSPNHLVVTRVTSREFLAGAVPPDASTAVDIDVFTPEGSTVQGQQAVAAWIEEAHKVEKEAFRRLLPDNLYDALLEKHSV